MKAEYKVAGKTLDIVHGSVTRYHADALVCPANPDLEMVAFPGGVLYAFLSEGGPEIFKEASEIGQQMLQYSMDTVFPMAVPPTSAHITTAGSLPAKQVIHTCSVGYDIKSDNIYCDKDIIERSTRNVLELAKERGLKSIGFPTLGTGLYSVPMEEAIDGMSDEFSKHLEVETTLERIGLILYEENSFQLAKKIYDQKFNSQ